MKLLTAAMVSLAVMVASCAQMDTITRTPRTEVFQPMLTRDDVRTVAPALDRYTQDRLLGGLWKRPVLSPRDRSLITVAALIARNQTIELPYYVSLALDNGVRPSEMSEVITHLAFYAGWPAAMTALQIARKVFEEAAL